MNRLYLFGPPRLERNGQPIEINLRKALALLVYLAITRQPHSRDALATLFWPEQNQQSARANLRRTLYDLNQLLGGGVVEASPETVMLHPTAPLWLDTEHFRRTLSAPPAPQPLAGDSLIALVAVAELYTGDFLAGFTLPDCPAFDDWQFFQREDLRRSFAMLLQQLVLTYEAQGKFEEAVRYARRWLALDPLEEAVHRHLMQLYAQAGQGAAALHQYEECVRILAEELDVPPTAETTALSAAIRTRRFPLPGRGQEARDKEQGTDKQSKIQTLNSKIELPSHNLPPQTTPFVGREHELAELLGRLADPACRLLTLVAPGGMGKTRLALEAAQRIVDGRLSIADWRPQLSSANQQSAISNQQFKDGVYFVPLQPVYAVEGIVAAIANALGLQFHSSAAPQAQLLGFLRAKQMLLVLDNFEHLLAGADLVAELLASAPGVRVLVTSREALKLQEEWFHPLAGLRLPPQEQPKQGAVGDAREEEKSFANYDAVQLFLQTARRSLVAFDANEHAEAIIRICRLVDGMPLGIELAASWLRVLTPAQIAQEIEQGIDILVARHHNAPERHRNMRVVLEHSWQMLDERTQAVLKRLAVFQGSFQQEAAASVAEARLLTLAELVDNAWLYRTSGNRYQMHELLRQFAAEKLAEDRDEAAATSDRHSQYYLDFLDNCAVELNSRNQRLALDEISLDIDNIRSAWVWAVAQRNLARIEQSAETLYDFYHIRSRYQEGEALLASAVAQLRQTGTAAESDRVETLINRLVARQGSFHLALGQYRQASELLQPLANSEDLRERAFVLRKLGHIAWYQADKCTTEAYFRESLALSRQSGDRNGEIFATLNLADQITNLGKMAEARQLAEECLALCRQVGRPDWLANALHALAWCLSCSGAYDEAKAYWQESLDIYQHIGDRYGIAIATNFIGWATWCKGEAPLSEVTAYYQQALALYREIGSRGMIAMGLCDLALAFIEEGKCAKAHRFAQEALEITEAISSFDLMVYALYCLGGAAGGLGHSAIARQHLRRALQMAWEFQHLPHLANTIYFAATLLIQEAKVMDLPTTGQGQIGRQVVELLTLVRHYPATWQVVKDRAARLQEQVEARLPSAVVAAARARGKSLVMESAVADLLSLLAARPNHRALDVVRTPPRQPLIEPLAARELEILRLIASGLTNAQIAEQLILSPGTVKWYSSEIYGKLGVASRTQAAVEARKLNLIN